MQSHVVGYANLNTPLYPQRVTVNEYRSQQDKPHKDVDVDTMSTFFFASALIRLFKNRLTLIKLALVLHFLCLFHCIAINYRT